MEFDTNQKIKDGDTKTSEGMQHYITIPKAAHSCKFANCCTDEISIAATD